MMAPSREHEVDDFSPTYLPVVDSLLEVKDGAQPKQSCKRGIGRVDRVIQVVGMASADGDVTVLIGRDISTRRRHGETDGQRLECRKRSLTDRPPTRTRGYNRLLLVVMRRDSSSKLDGPASFISEDMPRTPCRPLSQRLECGPLRETTHIGGSLMPAAVTARLQFLPLSSAPGNKLPTAANHDPCCASFRDAPTTHCRSFPGRVGQPRQPAYNAQHPSVRHLPVIARKRRIARVVCSAEEILASSGV